ncbi:MAG TPA: S41 family peptidase [Thermoanaerobaculia bacterium]|nr:S41 family peptidase [Thermoanaerobaculia bacterium]
MLRIRFIALTLALLAALAPSARAQGGPAPVSPQERHAVIEQLARLLNDHYVLPDVAKTTAAALVAKEKAGAYDALTDPIAFADAVTNDLKELGHDRHLRLTPKPPAPPGMPSPAPDDPAAEREEARVNNYGFREVRMLPGNIGYLRLDSFLPTPVAGRTAVAAMAFLAGSDALVFDLRNNGGGSPTMIQLLSSYLFEEPTHLNDIYRREGDHRDQFWTLPWIDGERRPAIPVYVLTSARTFSAAEEFTNNLKVLKRATVVGETTGGGANPGRTFDVGDRFEAGISTGRSINPTTGTNWEGTGVEPDLKVPAAKALLAAQAAALDALEAKAKAPDAKARYRFARLAIDGQLHPYTLPAGRAADYAGVFGPRRITAEGENLSYQREGGTRLRMKPLVADLFALETVDEALVRFDRDAAGHVVKLVMLYVGGEAVENPRTP